MPRTGLCSGVLMYYFSMDKNTIFSLKEGLFLLYDILVPATQPEEITRPAFSKR
jgi:hypothetical protein